MENWLPIRWDKKNSDILSSILGQFGANCSAFTQFEQQSIEAFQNYSQQYCNQYNSLCKGNGTLTSCQNCTLNSNFTALTLTTELINYAPCPSQYCPVTCLVGYCAAGNITIANCATNCLTPEEMNGASQVVALAAYHQIINELISRIQPYLGCSFIVAFIQAIYNDTCNQFLYGLELLVIGSAITGLLLLAFGIEMIYSIDRFNPSKREDFSQDNDEAWDENLQNRNMWAGTIGFVPSQPFIIGGKQPTRSLEKGYSFSMTQKDRNPIPDFGEQSLNVASAPLVPITTENTQIPNTIENNPETTQIPNTIENNPGTTQIPNTIENNPPLYPDLNENNYG